MDRRIEAGYWRDVIGAEYDALPGLSLTVAQAMRLWAIDEDIARRVLDSYVESGYLTLTRRPLPANRRRRRSGPLCEPPADHHELGNLAVDRD